MPPRISSAFTFMISLMWGCAAPPAREVQFHEDSGLTWASLNEAVVLARAAPQYAVAARDYVYVGPVEINRAGSIEHYLWVGVASTVDRNLRGGSSPPASTVLFMLDGEPFAFPLSPWEAEFSASPYEAQVPVAAAWRTRVSLDQIQKVARAGSVEVHVITNAGATARYELWEGVWSSWLEFPAKLDVAGLEGLGVTGALESP